MVVACHPILAQMASISLFLSNFAVAAGTSLTIHQALRDKETFWLPLMLAVMIFMRIPNQICLAISKGGFLVWFGVAGSMMAIASLSFLTYLIIKNMKRDNEKINHKE